MAVIRTRLIFWLIKAYFKKWGKLFVFFFVFGLFIFFLLIRFYPVILRYIPLNNKTVVGLTGAYETTKIPDIILNKVGKGLTKVEADGKVKPDLATSWEIQDAGKTYIFKLKKNQYFTNGTPFTSKTIQYSFKDVAIERPDDYSIVFKLKDAYAPFLLTVAQPVFYKGYIGIGEYTINNIELNGNFIESIQLLSTKNRFITEDYVFYPTAEALKIAFVLGEVTNAYGLTNTQVNGYDMQTFPNLNVSREVNYGKLITLFYNMEDPVLSDKKWRNGLSYATPDAFPDGVKAISFYPPTSPFFNDTVVDKSLDLSHAKLLISSAMEAASASAAPKITLKTLNKYEKTAEVIKESWSAAGIDITIEKVDSIPQSFQIYLGDFNVSKDPDQYVLWHSAQNKNITKIKNVRIDKLLEDGRRETEMSERIRIYNDLQKYLLDEAPATFLYFPYEYNVERK